MLKTHYVGGLLEGKAKGQTKRNTQRTHTINKSNTLFSSKCLTYLISATFLSAGPHQTSCLNYYSDMLGFPSLIQQINARKIFLKYQFLLELQKFTIVLSGMGM